MSFKNEFRAEWTRLNPVLCRAGDGLKVSFLHAARETPYGYFAPLRMSWWLVKRCLKEI